MTEFCLLLTATIDPKGTPLVARSDPAVRLRDYEKALTQWLGEPSIRKIVFCENSGYNLATLCDIVNRFGRIDSVEFLSLTLNEDIELRGKGFCELFIIEHVLKHSRLISEDDIIIKCVGRYFVSNIGKMIRYIRVHGEYDIVTNLQKNLTFSDSRIFFSSKIFLEKYLLEQRERVDDSKGFYLEHALAAAALRAVADGHKWSLLPYKPSISAFSGTHNTRIYSNPLVNFVAGLYYPVRRYVFQR